MRKWPSSAAILMSSLVAALSEGAVPSPGAAPAGPNVILILLDDAGVETVGAYGGDYRTPRIDALARDGVRFENAHATPLCTPSRVRLLTGRYSFRNYKAFGQLDPAEPTIARLLRQSGYRTAAAGKWQLAGSPLDRVPGSTPSQAGFDEWRLWNTEPDEVAAGCRYWTPTLDTNGRRQTFPGHFGPDLVNDFALDFIERHRDRPFFLYYAMILPHDPFVATPVHRETGSSERYFAAMIEYLDYLTGTVLDRLETLGIADRTLVVLVADNGTHPLIVSRRHGVPIRGGKGTTLDTGTHVPLIMRWPARLQRGVVDAQMVDLTDLFATIVTAGGRAGDAARSDGRDLLPSLVTGASPGRQAVFMDFDADWWPLHPVRYAFTERWKLYDDGRFFDVVTDPAEQEPLDRAVERATRERLQRTLDSIGGHGLDLTDSHFPPGFDTETIDYGRVRLEMQEKNKECGDPSRVLQTVDGARALTGDAEP
jgi:arylsulfatase A